MEKNYDLKSINGVEIFSVGKWNGDNYTLEDLNEMVRAFNDNKKGVRPYIKLGHDSKQKLIQSDGMPAAGWIDKIYVSGNKLVADFVDIPSKIYDLIKTKAYRKVSSEIFWNIKIGEKIYKRMLAAVALLGADTPGVMNLNDILAQYNNKETYEKIGLGEELDLKLFDLTNPMEGDFMEKTEKEIKLELELQKQKEETAKLEAEKKEFSKKQEDAEKELSDLKQYKKDAEEREAKLLAEREQAEVEKFFTQLVADGHATPAMKEHVMELCGPEKKEYTKEKLSKQDTIKEMLKLFKAGKDVNLEENSSKADQEKKQFADEMDKKAKAYMEDKKCSYGEAMKAVMKEKNKK